MSNKARQGRFVARLFFTALPPLRSAAFTPPFSLVAVPGTVLLLTATSPATLLSDTSGTGAVVTGGVGATYSSDFPCDAAPTTATSTASGAGSALGTLGRRLSTS